MKKIFCFLLVGLFQLLCLNSLSASNLDNMADDYDKLWKKVEKAEAKDLTQDALAAVQEIYNKAKQEKNYPNYVKAVAHILKYKGRTDTNADSANIMRLENEIRAAETPVKQIFQSMQAELFSEYYQKNRWKILERTRVQGDQNNKNFLTWDAQRLQKHIFKLCLASVANRSELEKIKITDYKAILKTGDKESARLRPSLYDLLAHRALDYFMTDEYGIARPADRYELPAAEGLATWTNFLKIKFETPDSTSKDLHAAHIFQNLLRAHKDSVAPLIDVDLKRLQWAYDHSRGEVRDSLYLAALQDMAKKYASEEVVAEVYAKLMYFYIKSAEAWSEQDGDKHKGDYKKAVEICDISLRRFPNASGTKKCLSLKNNILRKEIEIATEEIEMPEQPAKFILDFRNHYDWHARIVAFDAATAKQLGEEYKPEKAAKLLAALPAIKSWQFELSPETDYRKHAAEVYIPALPAGKYWLVVSDNAAFEADGHAVAYTEYQVCSFAAATTPLRDESGIEILVSDRKTGFPVGGVNVEIWKQYAENPEKTSLTTDESGKAVFKNADGSSYYQNYNLQLRKGNEGYEMSFYDYYGRNPKTEQQQVFFFTDRSIYRPGQTVYFKGICLKKTGATSEILSNFTTQIELRDANNQKVAELALVSNEYGAVNGTFVAPSGGLTGSMSLYETATNSYHSFRVEEYKRPKFEVKMDPYEGAAKLGEKVVVKGSALGFAGDVVSGANVSYRVERQAQFPLWDYYCWWRPRPYTQPANIKNGVVKTDDKGNFTIEFDAIPDFKVEAKDKPNFTYNVYVDVSDLTGETHSAEANVTFGYVPMTIELGLKEVIYTDATDSISVNTVNLNGVAQPAQGTITIYRLEMPTNWFRERRWQDPDAFAIPESDYRRNYPQDSYKQEYDERNWKRSSTTANLAFDTGKDKNYNLDFLKTAPQGRYLVEAQSITAGGDTILNRQFFTLADRSADKPAVPKALDISTNKLSLQPGDTLQVFLRSSENNLFVRFMAENTDKLIYQENITLKGGRHTITIPITEELRGGFNLHAYAFCQNREFQAAAAIDVPWSNKEIKVALSTYRNKMLPGSKEEWRLTVSGKQSEKVAAEVLAAMYDISLDEFVKHSWNRGVGNFFSGKNYYRNFSTPKMATSYGYVLQKDWFKYMSGDEGVNYDELNWFGYEGKGDVFDSKVRTKNGKAVVLEETMTMAMMAPPAPPAAESAGFEMDGVVDSRDKLDSLRTGETGKDQAEGEKQDGKSKSEPQIRKNLQETAFFFPTLMTNEQGEVVFSFTMPEALTKWKFMAFAHSKDLQTGYTETVVQTQKDFMMQPSAPRFLRNGDVLQISAKVTNLSENDLAGNAELKIMDAFTGGDITQQLLVSTSLPNFNVAKGQNALVSWELKVPDNLQAVTYQVIGKAGTYSDGEENTLPVVTNQILVTEALPLWVRGNQTKTFKLENLLNADKSTTLRHQKYTLEFTSQPLWYAVQALPYLMEYPHECNEQIFSRYYANALATKVANSTPRIQQVFDLWKNAQGGNSTALMSNLEKNQELKSAILSETPWVMEAQNESERKKRIALLFDVNKMASELSAAENKLLERQKANGAYAWFPGMSESSYITQLIATGIGHLNKLNVPVSERLTSAMQKSVAYVDEEMTKEYKRMKAGKDRMDDNHLSYYAIQYLYMRSFYTDLVLEEGDAYKYYFNQAKEFAVQEKNPMLKGMLALILYRGKEVQLAKQLLDALRQNAITSPELGMYWKQESGWYWHQAPIETQALLIEAFNEIDNDVRSVEEMKVYLLKNKQTNDWKTTRATVEACNALIATQPNNWDAITQTPEIIIGSTVINPENRPDAKTEAGTGYFKTSWQPSEIRPGFGEVRISKQTAGSAWGAVYWQYFENMDKVQYAATPLSIQKELFVEQNTPNGPTLVALKGDSLNANIVKQGDKVVVRVIIRTDREMEYVHLKDMRAAGFEPTSVLSDYQYKNGLGYYQSTKDLATHFFMDYLPVGTHVFEYSLRATHKGDYSNGITTMQCMYAPEFTTHSQGMRVKVE